ncbi:MAG: Peptidyl-prolyl cis-trans isomerase [uncultured bacterium]|nr:MAG: Peptidyl-prolyl cis-trans isomerase [uncultured bacterium]
MRFVVLLVISFNLILSLFSQEQTGDTTMIVSTGKQISIEYTLKVEGAVVDSNTGKDALTFTQGEHQILPAMETQVEGLKAGDSKQFNVNPEDGYGPVNPQALIEVPNEQMPPNALKVGAMVKMKGDNEQVYRGIVKELKEKTVMIDFNHPLAGKTLEFDIKVLNIQNAVPAPAAVDAAPVLEPATTVVENKN